MNTVDDFKKWLNEPQYKTRLHEQPRHNWQLPQGGAFDPRDLADIPGDGGERTYTQEFRTYKRGVAYKIHFKVSDVVVEKVCEEHDWGEWQYDFMGGDIRTCNRCGEVELV